MWGLFFVFIMFSFSLCFAFQREMTLDWIGLGGMAFWQGTVGFSVLICFLHERMGYISHGIDEKYLLYLL